ncbi:MAG: hypothetical protein U0790_14810 [Isosphaeraceae bacterium]
MSRPREIGAGPHLFLDDALIERIEGLQFRSEPPERLNDPILSSKVFGCTQPYLTVVRDRERSRYRLWYNRGSAIGYAESGDGVSWENPRVAWDLPRSYGSSLVDDGEGADPPGRRFKLANWQATRAREDRPGDDGGMYVGFSPDGLRWMPHDGNPVLPTWPEGYDRPAPHGVGDIVDVYRDPILGRYGSAVKLHAVPEDGLAPGPRAGKESGGSSGSRRVRTSSTGSCPRRIFVPDEHDEGLLEFYGMGAVHLRGTLRIGLVRVLRDDLPCDPGGPKDGIGYSVLATSRDGIRWTRRREPFLDRNPEPGSWDHAMTWIGAALPVGDEVHFYYGGYARGHKVAPTTERQIGLARMKRDRYLALVPERDEGRLLTRPFLLPRRRLTINSRAPRGPVRVRMVDPAGQLLAESRPVEGDVLAAPVHWAQPPERHVGRPVRLEFRVRHAALFGFEFVA